MCTAVIDRPVGEKVREGILREVNLRRAEEVSPLLTEVESTLVRLGYTPLTRLGVRLALGEAIANGLRHGNQGDPAKRVRVCYWVDHEALLAEVEDEGPGFDTEDVPDPTDCDFLERPTGRGLFLMRHYTTWLRFHGRGNRVTLCKVRLP